MKRKIEYICSECGRKFRDKRECQAHEIECRERTFFLEHWQRVLRAIIQNFERQGFRVNIKYDSEQGEFISNIFYEGK